MKFTEAYRQAKYEVDNPWVKDLTTDEVLQVESLMNGRSKSVGVYLLLTLFSVQYFYVGQIWRQLFYWLFQILLLFVTMGIGNVVLWLAVVIVASGKIRGINIKKRMELATMVKARRIV